MAQISTLNSQIGKAWGTLRAGDATESIKEFESIVQTAKDNVDAYYGMGMALSKDGQEAKAIEAFQSALDAATTHLHEIRNRPGNTDSGNNLNTTEDDRYMMLSRMIRQRLHELGVDVELPTVI